MIANETYPKVGMIVGKCRLKKILGRGSSAVLFKGIHETLDIPVTVKILLLSKLTDPDKVRRQFCTEARTLAKLNHPYIVRILDFDETPYLHIVLEYIDGSSLEELITRYEYINYQIAAYYIYRAAVALLVAHQNGVVHRDVKPANILITKDGRAKLTDLGVAYCATNFKSLPDPQRPKSFKGTPAYVAPEQVLEPNSGDPRSDIYSLGATFYHAVTGSYPFFRNSVYSAVMSHVSDPLLPPHELVDIPAEVSLFIQKMMEKDPNERFQTVEDLLPELISFFSQSGTQPPEGPTENSLEPLMSLSGTVTTILIRAASNSIKSPKKILT